MENLGGLRKDYTTASMSLAGFGDAAAAPEDGGRSVTDGVPSTIRISGSSKGGEVTGTIGPVTWRAYGMVYRVLQPLLEVWSLVESVAVW